MYEVYGQDNAVCKVFRGWCGEQEVEPRIGVEWGVSEAPLSIITEHKGKAVHGRHLPYVRSGVFEPDDIDVLEERVVPEGKQQVDRRRLEPHHLLEGGVQVLERGFVRRSTQAGVVIDADDRLTR